MADNSKEDLLQLVKRVGAFVFFKISTLIRSLDSRSFGAAAGLAFAIIFTWRLLRAPRGAQRRQPKSQSPSTSTSGVSNTASENAATSAATSPAEDYRTQNVVDEFFQPINPSLSQIVRQRLSEGRKVTCRLIGVILEETSPEELQKQATVRLSVLEVLLEITKFADLYLMERVVDDESEKRVLAALEDAGLFASGGLVKDKNATLSPGCKFCEEKEISLLIHPARNIKELKVLFCSMETGRASFVRQLEPDWHIDSNPEIITQLARFIRYELYVSPTKLERTAANVFTASSLEQFFGCV